jgi:hypothetical protein
VLILAALVSGLLSGLLVRLLSSLSSLANLDFFLVLGERFAVCAVAGGSGVTELADVVVGGNIPC